MMAKKHLPVQKGFTMMEILVASIILSLLAAGIFSVAVSGRNLIRRSRMRFIGSEIARHRLEEMRAEVRGDTWNTAANNLTVTGGWTGWTTAPENPLFETRRSVSNIAGSDCRNVTIQVRWDELQL